MTEDEMVGWHHNSTDMSLSKLQETEKNREALVSMGLQRFGYDLATEQQQPFYALKNILNYILSKFYFNVSVQIPSPLYSKQTYHFANKGRSSQGYGFSCGHVWL